MLALWLLALLCWAMVALQFAMFALNIIDAESLFYAAIPMAALLVAVSSGVASYLISRNLVVSAIISAMVLFFLSVLSLLWGPLAIAASVP